jgi:hypothetical protein
MPDTTTTPTQPVERDLSEQVAQSLPRQGSGSVTIEATISNDPNEPITFRNVKISPNYSMPCDCPACKRDNILNGTLTGECNHCHSKLDAQSSFQIMSDKTLVCEKCVAEHYIFCPSCNKSYKKSEAKEVSQCRGTQTLKICNRCFTLNYRECSNCHKFINRCEIVNYKDVVYCKDCFDRFYQVCAMCNTIYAVGTLTHIVRGRHKVCEKCFNQFGPINVYETKPKIEFQGKPPHYYGIELEVELENQDKSERGKKAQEVVDLFGGDFVIVKEDGSLQCGFEICTQPASKEEHLIRWGKFFDNLPGNLVSFNSPHNNCGLHIHCSKKPLSLLSIAKIVVFINDEKNQPYIETIAGRKPNRYFKIAKKNYSTVRQIGDGNRYEAVNLLNRETIEFRLFRGTLKRESFFKAIEFCDSIIQFCMTGNNGIAYCRNWDNYMDYIGVKDKDTNKDYPHLHAFMCAKFLKKETKLSKKFGFNVDDLVSVEGAPVLVDAQR